MADKEKNTETELKTDTKKDTKTKTEAAAKPKSKAKPKAKAEDKKEAKAASKTDTADVAPYKIKDSQAASLQAQKPKKNFSATLFLIAILAIVIITTAYQLNTQMSERSTQADTDTQENTVNAEPGDLSAQVNTTDVTAAPAAETQAEPANIEQASAVTEAPEQDAPPADQVPLKQAETQALTQAQIRSAKHYETIQQRRQEFEKRMQLKKQEYDAIVEAHKKERAKLAAEQNDVMLRIRQKNEETKLKVDEIRKQIYDLYQQINQIMYESSRVQRQ